MKSVSLVLLIVFVAEISLFSQKAIPSIGDQNNSSLSAGPSTRMQVPLSGSLVGKAWCDAEGNIYARIMDADAAKLHNATAKVPIQKIKPDGSLAGTFRFMNAAPDISARDFFVTENGKVYLEVYRSGDNAVEVLKFSNDGSIESTIQLDSEIFSPRQIVVFKSGGLLLSGTNGESNHTPYTAVFDATGKLIKKVSAPEDEYAKQRALSGDRAFVRDDTSWDNTSVVHGDADLGSDGNAYLLRATSPALVYVISPQGDILRKIRVESPSGLVAQRLKSSQGRLAISFLEEFSTSGVLEIVDLQGNMISSHTSDDRTLNPGLPGCYSDNSFTFLHAGEGNKVTVQRVTTK